jgi:molybdenum cofactor cytidylyltransferase
VHEIVVVTGREAEQVSAVAQQLGAQAVFNPQYAAGEMASSLQMGLRALAGRAEAVLVVLGDQPSLRAGVIRRVLRAYAERRGSIVAPSHNRRRGHPILIDQAHWADLLALPSGSSPREVINRASDVTAYVEADESVLRDIDTPEHYAEARRLAGLG